MARDHVSRDRALEWIRRQMPQQRMVELSHYVIVNDGVQDIDIQISQINNNINRLENDIYCLMNNEIKK